MIFIVVSHLQKEVEIAGIFANNSEIDHGLNFGRVVPQLRNDVPRTRTHKAVHH